MHTHTMLTMWPGHISLVPLFPFHPTHASPTLICCRHFCNCQPEHCPCHVDVVHEVVPVCQELLRWIKKDTGKILFDSLSHTHKPCPLLFVVFICVCLGTCQGTNFHANSSPFANKTPLDNASVEACSQGHGKMLEDVTLLEDRCWRCNMEAESWTHEPACCLSKSPRVLS